METEPVQDTTALAVQAVQARAAVDESSFIYIDGKRRHRIRSITVEYAGEVRPLARMTRYTRGRDTMQAHYARASYDSIEDARAAIQAAMIEAGVEPFGKTPLGITGEIRVLRRKILLGDIDNLIKAVLDSGQLPRGKRGGGPILWHDDRYIMHLNIRKVPVKTPAECGFSLTVQEIPPETVPAAVRKPA